MRKYRQSLPFSILFVHGRYIIVESCNIDICRRSCLSHCSKLIHPKYNMQTVPYCILYCGKLHFIHTYVICRRSCILYCGTLQHFIYNMQKVLRNSVTCCGKSIITEKVKLQVHLPQLPPTSVRKITVSGRSGLQVQTLILADACFCAEGVVDPDYRYKHPATTCFCEKEGVVNLDYMHTYPSCHLLLGRGRGGKSRLHEHLPQLPSASGQGKG